MTIAVTSHVGRDLLQNGAYFNSAPKVVMEYVSNSIDNGPDGHIIVVDVTINNSEITIQDNANGMSQEDLTHFFTMHGVNRQRKRGRKVRGRFGTGKSAAFGIADGLRVETNRDGLKNLIELHRKDILRIKDGRKIPVKHLIKDEPTDEPNGTTITVYDLQLDKIFITPIRERLERALGRHLDMHKVIVNGRRLKYRLPDAVETFVFEPPAEIQARMPNTSALKISVAREVLNPVENGIALLSNGFLNAMTLGEAVGKPHVDRIFGEVEIPDLDDEHDDEHFPAFDNTRDLSLNRQNPRAAMVLDWLSESAEQVRQELDIQAQLARLSEVNAQMQDAADFVGDLINADFARVQRRLRVASQSAIETRSIQSSEVVEIEVERPPEDAYDEVEAETVETAPEQEIETFPEIDYSEPDEPDAVPVDFEEPETPAIDEETTADDAYETFVEYMTELDYLEEKAYHEAVISEAAEEVTPEQRREIVQAALTDKSEDSDFDAEPTPMSGNGNREHDAPYTAHAAEPQYQIETRTVVGEHEVLVTGEANNLQSDSQPQSSDTYEERWVVDRDAFVAGQNPDTEPEKPAKKKYKKPQRRTYFHIQFEHMGEEAARARFSEEGRTIFINRDHPQIIYVEQEEGIDSLAYRNLMNEIVIQEYASAIVKQMASTGFYVADPFDAVETIQAVVNRLSLEAGQRLTNVDEEELAEQA